jgi:hypothetical protein
MPARNQPLVPQARTYRMRGMAVGTVVVLGGSMVGMMMADMSPLSARELAERALADQDVQLLEQAQAVDDFLTMPSLGAALVAIALLITWLYRARKNLDAFPEAQPWMRASWAIGGWFLPLVNMVVPGRMMASVVRESMPMSRWAVSMAWVWWVGWWVGGGTGWVLNGSGSAERSALPTEIRGPADYQAYIDYFGNELTRGTPGMIITMLAGVLLCYLIMRVSWAQDARIEGAAPPAVLPGRAAVGYPGPPPFAPPR